MPKRITYQAKILNTKYVDNIELASSEARFGSRTKENIPNDTLLKYSDHPKSLRDGWIEQPNIIESDNRVSLSNSKFIKDGRVIVPSLNGLTTAAYKETRMDSDEFVKIFGEEPVLGAPSSYLFRNPKAFLFNRKHGKISIEKEFKYKEIHALARNLADDEFISKEFSGQQYVLFGMKKPIPLSKFRDSNLDLNINDYLALSLNLFSKLSELNLDIESFLKMSDYTSIESLRIKSWDIRDLRITLKAQYFPVYPHVTVVADMEDGLQEIGLDFIDDVLCNRGVIEFDGARVSNTMGECKGFYLFYGCVPSVYHNSAPLSLPVDKILSSSETISNIGINDREQEGQVAISDPVLPMYRDTTHTSIGTSLYIPETYENVFLEPSAPIQINGKLYSPTSRMYFENSGAIKLELSAPDHLLELVDPATILADDVVKINSPIVGEAAALYGLFSNEKMNRLSLMSVHKLSDSTIPPESIKAAEALGYGQGNYSAGGFSLGSMETYKSTTTFSNENPYNYRNEYTKNISVRIKPEDDGYDFILPAWTVKNNIRVFEMSEKHYETFIGWKFVEPDIIMLDKDKVHPSRTYEVVYEAIASPYIPNLNLEKNTINIISDKDPASSYSSFKGLYLLSSKEIKIKIGHVNSLGTKDYFTNEITVHLIITNNYLDQTIARLKSISF